MKKIFIIVAISSLLGACNDSEKQQEAIEAAKRQTIDSINTANAIREQAIEEERRHAASYSHHAYGSQSNTAVTTEEKKKGLNNAAKGALIGAGTGAVAGAVLNKKHGEGAVVGGLIGAGAGAITGAIIDKNKKKKAAEQQKTPPK